MTRRTSPTRAQQSYPELREEGKASLSETHVHKPAGKRLYPTGNTLTRPDAVRRHGKEKKERGTATSRRKLLKAQTSKRPAMPNHPCETTAITALGAVQKCGPSVHVPAERN